MLNKKAAALRYDSQKQNAPKVLAAGRGEIARTIIEKARAYDIPLFQNEALAEALLRHEVGSEIDPALFKAVAEVFVWLARAEESIRLSSK
ncbi:EscU/YscU/HrcU family type III secretion system export apparatus switch protein [Hydrogenimonas sp.]